ncbi:hypothetical protein [Xenorhabdus siamensis]|uniref:hypothetical protein n=1 Tax=Xenorhabdus siamensis TaxID=3136254 RepID=UPI0030F41088
MEDYIFEKNGIPNNAAIDFITSLTSNKRIPFSKLIQKCDFHNIGLSKSEIDKVEARIKEHGKIDSVIKSVELDKFYSEKKFNSIKHIKKEEITKHKEISIIIKNIMQIDIIELRKYIQEEAFPLFKETEVSSLKSQLRKLFLAFDLLVNGDLT